jgi:hypothetical protein
MVRSSFSKRGWNPHNYNLLDDLHLVSNSIASKSEATASDATASIATAALIATASHTFRTAPDCNIMDTESKR